MTDADTQPDAAPDVAPDAAEQWRAAPGALFEANPTLWGYVLVSDFADLAPSRAIRLRRIGSAVMVLAAFGLWLAPGAIASPQVLLIKLGLTALFAVLALLLHARARQSLRREVQFDLSRGEVRAGWQNRHGFFQMESLHSFDEVDVVTLWQDDTDAARAWLILRLGCDDEALVVAQAPGAALAPWQERLARDLAVSAVGLDPVVVAPPRAAPPLLLGPRLEGAPLAA